MSNYKSNRFFKNWMYSVSHSTLIIRSEMKVDDYEGNPLSETFTIDIEFWGVTYLEIPINYEGISICTKKDNLSRFSTYLSHTNDKVFEIVSNGISYYIVAGGCIVGTSKWINQNRIMDFLLKYEEVIQNF